MYFIQYEVRPLSGSEHFATVGGAIVNCFIDAASEDAARELAATNFRDDGWHVVSIEDGPRIVERSDYLDEPDWLEWFDEADAEGECYVFHQWPPEDRDDQRMH